MIDAKRLDRANVLSTRLDALLAQTHGAAGDAFRDMGDERQEAYLWACADIARELKQDIEGLVFGEGGDR